MTVRCGQRFDLLDSSSVFRSNCRWLHSKQSPPALRYVWFRELIQRRIWSTLAWRITALLGSSLYFAFSISFQIRRERNGSGYHAEVSGTVVGSTDHTFTFSLKSITVCIMSDRAGEERTKTSRSDPLKALFHRDWMWIRAALHFFCFSSCYF